MSEIFTPAIIVHTAAAFAAVLLGAAVFASRKGTLAHRVAGRGWIALMALVAISSFWIRGPGGFSWIHGLSVFTLFAISGAVYYAIIGNIRRHRTVVIGTYAGALVVAGLFTLLPQRLLGKMLWASLGLV